MQISFLKKESKKLALLINAKASFSGAKINNTNNNQLFSHQRADPDLIDADKYY